MSMRLIESGTRLVVHDVPRATWILGVVFVGTGSVVLSVPFTVAAEWAAFNGWERLGLLVIGLGHLAGGLWTVMQQTATHTTLDRANGHGTQTVRHMWQRPDSVAAVRRSEFQLADVQALEIVESTDNDGSPTYRFCLCLLGSRRLWLQAQPELGARQVEKQAATLRHFLGLAAAPAEQLDESRAPAVRAGRLHASRTERVT